MLQLAIIARSGADGRPRRPRSFGPSSSLVATLTVRAPILLKNGGNSSLPWSTPTRIRPASSRCRVRCAAATQMLRSGMPESASPLRSRRSRCSPRKTGTPTRNSSNLPGGPAHSAPSRFGPSSRTPPTDPVRSANSTWRAVSARTSSPSRTGAIARSTRRSDGWHSRSQSAGTALLRCWWGGAGHGDSRRSCRLLREGRRRGRPARRQRPHLRS